jgi:hypothetical protein
MKHRINRILPTIAAVVAALFPYGTRADETKQLTLPTVTVTAPPLVPLYMRPGNLLKAYERNPYFGNNRVEESKFTPVPCSDNRIDPASAGASDRTCLQGDRLVPGYLHVSKGGDRDSKHCDIDHDVTIYNIGDLSVEADVLVFDPYKLTADGSPDPDCYVAGYTGYDQEDFQDMNRITRRGTDWHDLRAKTCDWRDLSVACQEKSIKFSYGPHDCIAVRRPGPRWEAGYVWMLTASICQTGTTKLQPDDTARALGALKIRQYDQVGNIRTSPK